ncbi:sulfatase-like hydrolase/transferase [Sinisalibacter lacisalsi]|uniref:Sulfatase n=1 Tax=Sinisalibacter lacisalsi TaxID=1526570 RepID=A0ABQ1QXT2_9RHOB|nr:sulfatase-like hydrolase/transferase [Sinisalibacter lacisalsi]GGD47521.1 sulfatase [Sinisalibacter lacisalsi]
MPRPEDLNLLFVTLDQLRADVVSGRLHGYAPTRNLDRLRAGGTTFLNCYTATVPCGPSRASLLTGLYAFNHRAIRNGTPLARHHATLGTELRKLGREPLLFGYNDITPDPTGRDLNDPDFQTYELPAPGFREIVEMRFENPLAWIGHLRGRGYDLPEPLPERWYELYRPVASEGGEPRIDDPALYSAADSDTAFLTDRTLEALDARRDTTWTAHVTYIRPHPPLVAPAPYNRLVDPAALPATVAPGAAHPFREAWFSQPASNGLWWGFDGDCAGMQPETAQALRAVYLGLVAELDHHLGRLLDWLDNTGQAERTVLIVMADHGEMLGDQGFWGKDNVLAPAHHIPLIIRAPGVDAGQAVEHMVSSVDIAPTILTALGGAVPPAMDGVPLQSLLAGEGAAPRSVFTEIDLGDARQPSRFQRALGLAPNEANAAILRDARWTCVHFNGGVPPMLFDRNSDPEERIDLSGDAAAERQIAAMRARMLDLRMTRADQRLTRFQFGA